MRLRSVDAKPVFLRIRIQGRSLLICHSIIGKPLPVHDHEICHNTHGCVHELDECQAH